jgi:hypothetical protein
MLVYCEYSTPRVRYVIHHVFERMLGLSLEWASGAEEFRSAKGPRLSYGNERFEGAVHLPWSGAITELPKNDPEIVVRNDGPALFPVGDEEDLFAGIFFLLSLKAEMHCAEQDVHGRVPSASLFTVRNGLSDRPWVDQRVMRLASMLETCWPGEMKCRMQYSNIVTVDMDNILRYAGRPFHRAVGASVKDLVNGAPAALSERWLVRSGSVRDPYARAIELVEAQRPAYHRAILFFLMRGEGEFDHAADPRHSATQALIQRAARQCEIGVHPSYDTERNNELHVQERTMLQRIIGRSVRCSRQHFLRWQIPETLRFLSGFEDAEDHTLGFSDRPGFRAGTCTPFPWYDLEREEETTLMLHPFAVMDSALIEQQKLDPDGVFTTMATMCDAVRAVKGQFISVWHDRYLSGHREFAPWPAVFERVMEHARA